MFRDIDHDRVLNANAAFHPFVNTGCVLCSVSYLLDRDRVVFQRLLPFTDYQESLVRRTGVIGAIKNCCFDTGERYDLGWCTRRTKMLKCVPDRER